MDRSNDCAVPSTSGAGQAPSSNLKVDPELDKILEDLVTMENEAKERTPVDDDETMAAVRNGCYSPEQLHLLVQIWAIKFENNKQRTPEAEQKRDEFLKDLVMSTNTEQILGDTLEECMKKIDKMLTTVDDCALCKLLVCTKHCINSCMDDMLASWDVPVICPFKVTGLSFLAMKEMKEEVEEMHKERCVCGHCAILLPQYNLVANYLSLHEAIHMSRGDIGFPNMCVPI